MSSSTSPTSTAQTGTPLQTRLANIPAQFIQEACEYLVNIIRPEYDDRRIQESLDIVRPIVQRALKHDPKLKRHLADESKFLENVKNRPGGEQGFIKSLRDMAKDNNSWERLFEDDVFITLKEDSGTPPELIRATERAWSYTFRGNAQLVLLETISDLLNRNRSPYARLTSIVNSSGTGKSRMVDELGVAIITVPMWFPPPDIDLREWLVPSGSVSSDQSAAQRRLHGFVYSLLTVTRTALEIIVMENNDVPQLPNLDKSDVENMSKNDREVHGSSVKARQAWLAKMFRELMTTGQSFNISNAYRNTFYKNVTDLADEFIRNSEVVTGKRDGSPSRYRSEAGGVEEAGALLCRFVDPHGLLDSAQGPRRPLVILAFDEAHSLTDNPSNTVWKFFWELRRVLRQIHDLAIFRSFSRRREDSSSRPLDPISEISFDDLAYLALNNTVTLDRVVQTDWISHLGRPLFGSRWDAMVHDPSSERNNPIIDFAKQKLLDGKTDLNIENRTGPRILACLSVRFALEFNVDGTARDKLVTVAGSEPLLAEAAYDLMKRTQTNAVRYLAGHSDLHCVDRGRRGELVAALLIMQAHDEARGESSGRRWVSVANFMKALLPTSKHDELLKCQPTFWREGEDKPFEETFKDYGMWFNHVIKIEDGEMFSVEHLWKFVTRGAMILCSNGQKGIDIVLPVCHTKQNLSSDSMTAILIQVKNAERFKKNIHGSLFDAMSPFDLGVFPEEGSPATVTPKPVIRLVFALASPKASVVFRKGATRKNHPDAFTAFDIWLAGLSADTFKQVGLDLDPGRDEDVEGVSEAEGGAIDVAPS
ncbi:hypothetical protein BJV77DRAFT_1068477 [Russula vinacea]|nr:hypothetical protein BJV77DRAFT_1068477 [Russula vinacea]